MKKVLFLLLSIFIATNIGYSQIQNFSGIIYNDEIFGKSNHCKSIGLGYIGLSYLVVVKNTEEITYKTLILARTVSETMESIDKNIRVTKGWRMYSSVSDNLDSYYKAKCNKIEIGGVINTNNSDKISDLTILIFYNLLETKGLLINN